MTLARVFYGTRGSFHFSYWSDLDFLPKPSHYLSLKCYLGTRSNHLKRAAFTTLTYPRPLNFPPSFSCKLCVFLLLWRAYVSLQSPLVPELPSLFILLYLLNSPHERSVASLVLRRKMKRRLLNLSEKERRWGTQWLTPHSGIDATDVCDLALHRAEQKANSFCYEKFDKPSLSVPSIHIKRALSGSLSA